jgi:hypothetical protein
MSSRLGIGAVAAALFALSGCTETPPKVVVRSLQESGDVTAVCAAVDGTGRPLAECPDFESGERTLLALVTQTMTDEVAVVRLVSGAEPDLDDGEVVDLDRSTPGYTFARLPGRPGDIVTSPGGAASFVGITSPGRQGIVALPTTCMGPPVSDEDSRRDITSFAGCSLPGTPGDLAMLVDAPASDGSIAVSCDRSLGSEAGTPASASRSECAADLTSELGPPGRRKLVVTLPDLGQLAVIDAQSLVDRKPGTYGPCEVERWVPLEVDLPVSPIQEQLPPDIDDPSCQLPELPTAPAPANPLPVPSGLALSDDGRLFVGDRGAPVIHVLDARSPCSMSELAPLLPQSLENPARSVSTSKVAVSPITPKNERFLYAVDEFDQPGASVMAFDVSPGSTLRTPIVRPGSPRLPVEPADRIGFASAAVDVGFALRDLPASDDTGVAVSGVLCDPRPDAPAPGGEYQPSSDLTSGARPALLRGVFGFVLLSSGQVVVIDVDDFDAPCRRPVETNPEPVPDFRGCVGDVDLPEFLTDDGLINGSPTVTGEVSCSVVQPHRVRAALPAANNSQVGVRAPSLTAFPQFSSPDTSGPTTIEGRPKLLAVDFDPLTPSKPQPAQVYVGSELYGPEPLGTALDKNPVTAQQNSLVLPLVEPRGYPSSESFSLTFEGAIMDPRDSGFFDAVGGRLDDRSADFCDSGVYSVETMQGFAAERFGLEGDALETFARQHADYVQITADFPDEDDLYWRSARASSCSRDFCETQFGEADARQLSPLRDLRILEAYQDHLVVEPREYLDEAGRAELSAQIDCCFPAGAAYTIRTAEQWTLTGSVSGFRHDVIAREQADGSFRCERDCDPRKKYYQSRVFELSRAPGSECPEVEGADDDVCPVGAATASDCFAPNAAGCGPPVCLYDPENSAGSVEPGGPGSECIVDSLNARFVVYRGADASQRGMVFAWQVTGGFTPLAMTLTSEASSVLPQSMLYLPEIQHLAVVDASTLGLALFSLDSLRVEAAFF